MQNINQRYVDLLPFNLMLGSYEPKRTEDCLITLSVVRDKKVINLKKKDTVDTSLFRNC